MITVSYYKTNQREGYTLNNGVLVKGKITGMTIALVDGNVGDSRVIFETDTTTLQVHSSEIFATVDDYKAGRPLPIELQAIDRSSYGIHDGGEYWILRNGEPMCRNIKNDTFDILYDGHNLTIEIAGVTERRYATRQDLFDHEDVIVFENGVRTVHQAPIKQLLLNDKQKEILQQLREVMKRATQENMAIVHVGGYGLCAWNKAEGSEMTWETTLDGDDEHAIVYPGDDLVTDIHFKFYSEDTALKVKKIIQ